MFCKKYIFLNVYSIVLVIYTFNVRKCAAGKSNSTIPNVNETETNKKTGTAAPSGDSDSADLKLKLEAFMTVPPMPFITVPYTMVFEGVDYDHLQVISKDLHKEYYDCFFWFTRCIRDMTYFHWICAYAASIHWTSMANQCQLDLENCRHRTAVYHWKESQGIYGTYAGDKWDRSYLKFYHGDGWNCEYNFRRNVPDDRVNFYYEDQYRRTMREIEENYNITI